jgi:hypothetical protein
MNTSALLCILIPWCLIGLGFLAYYVWDKKHVTLGDIWDIPLAISVGPLMFVFILVEHIIQILKDRDRVLFDWRKK